MESGAVRDAEPRLLPEVAAMLATLDSGFPDVTALTAPELRAMIRARRAPLQWLPAMRDVYNLTIAGPGGALPIRIYRPRHDASALPVIVFAHGGGFVFCDLDSHDEFCRSMADGIGAIVVSVDYRLAPEHPAPAAHDDMYAALVWSAEHIGEYGGDPAALVVAGDSAGGNLAATIALAARDHAGPSIAAQLLLYPVIDDDFDTESYRRFGTGYYNTAAAMRWYWQQYAPHGTGDPRLIPTRADSLAGLPPAVVITAELDPPCSSGDAYAQLLTEAGVVVGHHRYNGLFHGFLTIPALAVTRTARAEIWEMVRSVLPAR
ncbi:alpha/beta hydrolase [Nocardia sp. NBC_01329]|uniref:alpha/beta hydrolase n=1 Tax=Nocardia sp. NBC_01329 TaxID=2903594 RepID=UPI002E10A009|nr:alpha/beta hydrolase [Nocardia sp. NBC_01329]